MNDSITYMTTAVLIASYNSPIIGKVVSRINKRVRRMYSPTPHGMHVHITGRATLTEISGLPLTSARLIIMEK